MYIPRTQMTHILEDSTHKIEGQTPQERGQLGSRYINPGGPFKTIQ